MAYTSKLILKDVASLPLMDYDELVMDYDENAYWQSFFSATVEITSTYFYNCSM